MSVGKGVINMFEITAKDNDSNYIVLNQANGITGVCSYSLILSKYESGVQIKGVGDQDNHYIINIDNSRYHKVIKGYKLRLYPNKEQQEYFQKCFGCCRFLWNHMLADKIEYYNKYQESLDNQPADYKTEFTFLKEVDSQALSYEKLHLNTAFKNFFRDKSVGYPKFKKKHDNHKSFTTYNQRGSVKIIDKYVKLPKIGYVKLKQSQPVLGTIKNATVSQVPSGKYYISFNVEIWQQELPETLNEVGVDLGIKDLIILSDGTKFENPKILYKYEKQLAKLQRQLSHKKLHSNNWKKQKHKIAILHERVANIRKDNIHKITHQMIMENQLIVTEDLSVKNMMQNHHLAKSISDVSWYEISRQLAYKSDWFGRTYIKIDKFYASSQICSNCGYKNINIKNLAVREWTCPQCGTYHDRDINASNNILTEGKRLTALAI
jgi:putative transposase